MSLLNFFKPKWKHSDKFVRSKAVEKLTNQATLAKIAKNDEEPSVRNIAVWNINFTDQTLLTDIANNDKEDEVRITAARKLKDKSHAQKAYVDVAKNGKDAYWIWVAMNNLTDRSILSDIPNQLAKIAKNHPYSTVRMDVVKIITDQVVLSFIAKNDRDQWVRMAAMDMITNQVVLSDIFKTVKHENLREIATKKLTDKDLLAEIAKNDKEWRVREAAVENPNFTEQVILLEIAKNDRNLSTAARKKLTDQDFLAEIAKNDQDRHLRKIAVEKLVDQSLLSFIVKNDEDQYVRVAAVRNPNLTDHTFLADIAKNDEYEIVRDSAVENPNLTDQAVLVDIAKNLKSSSTARMAALKKITDQKILFEIAKTDCDQDVRRTASLAMKNEERISILRKQWEKKMVNASVETLIAIIKEMGGEYKGEGFDDTVYKAINKLKGIGIFAVESVIQAFGDSQMLGRWWATTDNRERVASLLISEITFEWLQKQY